MPSLQRIALVMHEDSVYTRNVLKGIHTFALPNRNWLFHLFPPETADLPMLMNWEPDGIITHAHTEAMQQLMLATRIPVVNTASILANGELHVVCADDRRIGQLGAEHLLGLGLKCCAFLGFHDWRFSVDREVGFTQTIKEAKSVQLMIRHHPPPTELGEGAGVVMRLEKELEQWLTSLPVPTGIMACNDYLGLQLINACRSTNMKIPDSIAIIGVDNDELLCEMAYPPLSSVAIPINKVGYEAARLLDLLMQDADSGYRPEVVEGQPNGKAILLPPTKRTLLEPGAVIARQSSNRLAADDPLVAKALQTIHDNRDTVLLVDDLLRILKVSRRTLERAFRKTLGRTPLQEIRRVHMEQAKVLLTQTELTMQEVAWRSGFSDGKHLATVFKQLTGLTPATFRKLNRPQD